ncbi:MAG TPA: hypothetical protein VN150_07965 [Ochrobactrum sp.]|nr:hypothetical protein [Ochrobactrum sp.]
MADELKDQRVVTMMSPTELEAIDDWMFKNRIRSRGEAIRRLCQLGLITNEVTPALIARSTKALEWANEQMNELVKRNRNNVPEREIVNFMIGSFLGLQGQVIDIFGDVENLNAGHDLLKSSPSMNEAIQKLNEFRIDENVSSVDGLQRIVEGFQNLKE